MNVVQKIKNCNKKLYLFTILSILIIILFDFLNLEYLKFSLGSLILLFVPGFYLSFFLHDMLKWYEIIFSSAVLSLGVLNLFSFYLNYTPLHISFYSIIFSTLVFISFLELYFYKRKKIEFKKYKLHIYRELKHFFSKENNIKNFFIYSFIFLIPTIILFQKVYQYTFFIAWDPWLNKIICEGIALHNLNPSNLSNFFPNYNLGYQGFFFFLTGFKTITGLSYYYITKFGSIFLFLFSALPITFSLQRVLNKRFYLYLPLFLIANPSFTIRFTLTIRENFAFVFFCFFLFLIFISFANKEKKINLIIIFSFLFSLLCLNHILTFSISIGIVFLVFFMRKIFNLKYNFIEVYIPSLLCGIFLALPQFLKNIKIYVYSFKNWSVNDNIFSVIIISVVFIVLLFFFIEKIKFKIKEKNSNLLLLIAILLFIGAIFSIIFKYNLIDKGWNPKISILDFFLIEILLSCFGFYKLWLKREKFSYLSASFLITLLIVMNIPNIGLYFPLYRLVIYISLLLAIFSVVGITCIYKNTSKIMKTSLISIIILSSVFLSIETHVSSNLDDDRYEDILILKEMVEKNSLVIPQEHYRYILPYFGIENVETNGKRLEILYNCKNKESFLDNLNEFYPSIRKFYFFIPYLERDNLMYPDKKMLEDLGEKIELNKTLVYVIQLN